MAIFEICVILQKPAKKLAGSPVIHLGTGLQARTLGEAYNLLYKGFEYGGTLRNEIIEAIDIAAAGGYKLGTRFIVPTFHRKRPSETEFDFFKRACKWIALERSEETE